MFRVAINYKTMIRFLFRSITRFATTQTKVHGQTTLDSTLHYSNPHNLKDYADGQPFNSLLRPLRVEQQAVLSSTDQKKTRAIKRENWSMIKTDKCEFVGKLKRVRKTKKQDLRVTQMALLSEGSAGGCWARWMMGTRPS